MKSRAMAFVLAMIVALSACADGSTDESVPGSVTSDTTGTTTVAADSQNEALGNLEGEIDSLGEAITSSEAGQELSSAWNTLKVELAAAIATLRSQGDVAREEIQTALDTFEQKLDDLDVEENVTAAWDQLRSHVEELTS